MAAPRSKTRAICRRRALLLAASASPAALMAKAGPPGVIRALARRIGRASDATAGTAW
jgi:hypothetical protein